ncbi:MAG: GNAT family N-acetyltransferase [Rhodothermales bacterium]
MSHPSLTIRHLQTYDEIVACRDVQQETWGEAFVDLVPPSLLVVTQKIGGILAGAFTESNELVAFVYGVQGRRNGHAIHWSHMMAVRPAYRGSGIGRDLKLFQRDFVLNQGIRRIHWTYDPLEALNANLNLNRLGAFPEEYVRDLYGDGSSSILHSTIGTDRYVVTWHLLEEDRLAHRAQFEDAGVLSDLPIVNGAEVLEDSHAVRVEIPVNVQQVKKQSADQARAWRQSTRKALELYLGAGFGVVGYYQDPDTKRCFYILARRRAA